MSAPEWIGGGIVALFVGIVAGVMLDAFQANRKERSA